jgi:outer membrane murein-binding lipoprotein Lpp
MSTFVGGRPNIRSLESIRVNDHLTAECFDDLSTYSQNLAAQVASLEKTIIDLEARVKALGG